MKRMSVATIDSPEFINITSISPFISKCEIKILYVGENRNNSLITKEVATEMAQTLPGCPIVGYYLDSKEDFSDHGEQVIIDGEGIKFKKLTQPYGFVAPNSRVQFQKFEETDDFGNTTIRDYLMTEGYLWTGQYEECQRVINKGNNQSMELDKKTLKGHWSTDNNRGVEFFIINDAIFSKLCILGEDVEPCFEGASITAPEVSSRFSKNEDFTKTLFTMMKELKELTFSLNNNKGGSSMEFEEKTTSAEELQTAPVEEKFSAAEDNVNSEAIVENQNNIEEFAKKNDDDDKEEGSEKEDSDDVKDEDENNDDEKKEPKTKHSLEEEFALVKQELEELKSEYSLLKTENEELSKFKNDVENERKDALINSFYMLSDEDKKDVIDNKTKYSLDDIEAKLSVICVRKKVSFSKEEEDIDQKTNMPEEIFTYNLNQVENDPLPAWLKAVEAKKNEKN